MSKEMTARIIQLSINIIIAIFIHFYLIQKPLVNT